MSELQSALRRLARICRSRIAWHHAEHYGADRYVGHQDFERIDLTWREMPLLEKRFSEQMNDALPAAEIDRRLLRYWNEPLLHDCFDAGLWRDRYEAARQHAMPGGAAHQADRIDEDITALIWPTGRSRPAEPPETRWLLRYQLLVEATRGANLRQAANSLTWHCPVRLPEYAAPGAGDDEPY